MSDVFGNHIVGFPMRQLNKDTGKVTNSNYYLCDLSIVIYNDGSVLSTARFENYFLIQCVLNKILSKIKYQVVYFKKKLVFMKVII